MYFWLFWCEEGVSCLCSSKSGNQIAPTLFPKYIERVGRGKEQPFTSIIESKVAAHIWLHSCSDLDAAIQLHWRSLSSKFRWPFLSIREKIMDTCFQSTGTSAEACSNSKPQNQAKMQSYSHKHQWIEKYHRKKAIKHCTVFQKGLFCDFSMNVSLAKQHLYNLGKWSVWISVSWYLINSTMHL